MGVGFDPTKKKYTRRESSVGDLLGYDLPVECWITGTVRKMCSGKEPRVH